MALQIQVFPKWLQRNLSSEARNARCFYFSSAGFGLLANSFSKVKRWISETVLAGRRDLARAALRAGSRIAWTRGAPVGPAAVPGSHAPPRRPWPNGAPAPASAPHLLPRGAVGPRSRRRAEMPCAGAAPRPPRAAPPAGSRRSARPCGARALATPAPATDAAHLLSAPHPDSNNQLPYLGTPCRGRRLSHFPLLEAPRQTQALTAGHFCLALTQGWTGHTWRPHQTQRLANDSKNGGHATPV
ncbi:uncharacterized protein LOC124984824 [Sciurus carolinensis]|uniref:uncharacterized protein LOC124984824 n=1 Tax=Sciurus carolinensis TaxID=30640 RepID=UPI001FB3B335|nr:uncharacterized protein LOC124984824 [Sciurus carolinensis]